MRLLNSCLSVALLACSALLCSCEQDKAQQDPAPRQGRPRVGMVLYWSGDPFIAHIRKNIEQRLADKADLEVMFSENDQFLQDEQVHDFLNNKKVDALIVNLVDQQSGDHVVESARKHKLPVVFFNREPRLEVLKGYYGNACYVGTIPEMAGKLQGDIIAELMARHPEYDRNGDGKVQYVLFQGEADNPEAIGRTEHSIRTALSHGVTMVQLGDNYQCNWDREQARKSMRLVLATYGDSVEMVVSNNDTMALGAIAALQEQGCNRGDGGKYIPVIGVDAIPDAISAINKGHMSATVRQDGSKMAEAVAGTVLNALNGKDFLEGTGLEWDESGVAIRLPYERYVK